MAAEGTGACEVDGVLGIGAVEIGAEAGPSDDGGVGPDGTAGIGGPVIEGAVAGPWVADGGPITGAVDAVGELGAGGTDGPVGPPAGAMVAEGVLGVDGAGGPDATGGPDTVGPVAGL